MFASTWAMALIAAAFGRPRRASSYCQVVINGQDVTSRFDPYLIAVTVTDFEMAMDTCVIDLDDSHGVLLLPPDQSEVTIRMGWPGDGMKMVFTGKVSDVSSSCQRRTGRLARIEATGADLTGQGKVPTSQEWGEGSPTTGEATKVTAGTVLEEAAKKAGYSFSGAANICAIERDYWAMTNESFHNFSQRLAKELGGVIKISGNQVSLTSNVNNLNASGKTMPDVVCEWGANLMAWNIHPKVARPVFAETNAMFFDGQAGKWDTVKKVVGATAEGLSRAIHFGIMPVASKDRAQTQAVAEANASMRARGYGWLVIDGEPSAAAGCNCIVKGARAGVDGQYRIVEAEHSIDRRRGFTTRLSVNQPGPTTGQGFVGEFER